MEKEMINVLEIAGNLVNDIALEGKDFCSFKIQWKNRRDAINQLDCSAYKTLFRDLEGLKEGDEIYLKGEISSTYIEKYNCYSRPKLMIREIKVLDRAIIEEDIDEEDLPF